MHSIAYKLEFKLFIILLVFSVSEFLPLSCLFLNYR